MRQKLPTTVPSLVLCYLLRAHVNQSTNELSLVRNKKRGCVAQADRTGSAVLGAWERGSYNIVCQITGEQRMEHPTTRGNENLVHPEGTVLWAPQYVCQQIIEHSNKAKGTRGMHSYF